MRKNIDALLATAAGKFRGGRVVLARVRSEAIISAVSASGIIKELPKLSEAERRAIREGLLEIANQDSDVALCNQTALDGALILDRTENEYT